MKGESNELIIPNSTPSQTQTTQRVTLDPSQKSNKLMQQQMNGDETDLEKQKLINQLIQQQNQIEQQKRMEKQLQDRQMSELIEKERRKMQPIAQEQPIGRVSTGSMSRMGLEEAINSLLEERKVDPKDRDTVIRQLLNELNQQQQQAPITTTSRTTFQQQQFGTNQQIFQGNNLFLFLVIL
jgi:hypothetical protein